MGVERSKVEVQFRDLFVQAEVLIGDSGLPTVSNSFKGLLEVICGYTDHAFVPFATAALYTIPMAHTLLLSQRLGKLVGRSGAEKAKMTILKGVSGALKPVSVAKLASTRHLAMHPHV